MERSNSIHYSNDQNNGVNKALQSLSIFKLNKNKNNFQLKDNY